jgi:uncharacterized protein (TIGR02145 family)
MKTKNRIWLILLIIMGLIIVFTNSCKKSVDIITDVDGNDYTKVTIGTQVWMVENLKTTRYSNGDLVGTTTPATLDISSEATPKYQWAYDGNESNVATYGRLYTWYTATDSRNVCPIGWHVPSDAEWTTLTTYLGGEETASGKLKETGTAHWITPNTGATNESGFTARPSGYRFFSGSYYTIGSNCFWWSSTEISTTNACFRGISYITNNVASSNFGKQLGFSVRCIEDN